MGSQLASVRQVPGWTNYRAVYSDAHNLVQKGALKWWHSAHALHPKLTNAANLRPPFLYSRALS